MESPAMKGNSDRPENERAAKAVVLVADDNEQNRDLLAEVLASHGYKVLLAKDGFEVYKEANEKNPDLILLDIMMPGIDGLQVCRQLKKNPSTADIPVIFATALDKNEDLLKGFKAGGVDYVTKPLIITEVLARVDAHVKLRRLEKERQQAVRNQMEARHWKSVNAVTEGLAHNFNNLLASAIGNIQFARKTKIDTEAEEALDDAMQSLRKTVDMVKLMREYQELEPLPEKKTPAELIKEAAEKCGASLAPGIEFDMHIQQDLPDILPDAARHLQQALEAVMTNAAEAMDNTGRVEVRAASCTNEMGREFIRIEVTDHGPGLAEDMQHMAFLPFHSTKGNVGVGLGLYAARLSIEEIGGTITLVNNEAGGATATITVPASL